jgi:hypothetical protein
LNAILQLVAGETRVNMQLRPDHQATQTKLLSWRTFWIWKTTALSWTTQTWHFFYVWINMWQAGSGLRVHVRPNTSSILSWLSDLSSCPKKWYMPASSKIRHQLALFLVVPQLLTSNFSLFEFFST